MAVYLIRHTQPQVEPGTCYGRLDVELAAESAMHIATTTGRVPQVAKVYTSPARRCLPLAAAIAQRDGCAIDVFEALLELDFGEWEGKPWSSVQRVDGDHWAQDTWTRRPPQGESESELWSRVSDWYARELSRQVALSSAGTNIAVVAHAGPLRILRCLLLDLPREARWSWRIDWGECVCCMHAATHSS